MGLTRWPERPGRGCVVTEFAPKFVELRWRPGYVKRDALMMHDRARYDADQMVAAFAARLQDAVDLGTVRSELLSTVDQALEPAHVTVWTGPAD
jgi:hypothetical protein